MIHSSFINLPDHRKSSILQSGITEFSKKSYSDANTDEITKNCGISKGLLFHYFGSKREFYFYCLEQALARLTTDTPQPCSSDFYGIIFYVMDEKFRLCREFAAEMRFVNMAAREMKRDVYEQKTRVLAGYIAQSRANSARIMALAIATLKLKTHNVCKVTEALSLYVSALINNYLEIYRERPDEFIAQADTIKLELREYLEFVLRGVVKEE